MNPRDFLDLASRLARGSDEAECRTATGRAYYAAFHVAKQFMTEVGFIPPRDESAHQYLIQRLSNSGNASGEQAGRALDWLRTERNTADYELRKPWTSAVAGRSVQRAEEVFDAIDALRQEPARSEVVNGMRTYERTVRGVVTWRPPPSP